MEIKENIGIEGIINIKIYDNEENMNLICDTGLVRNLITSAGKAQLALLAGDASAVPFTYIALGTSATAVNIADTTLGAEITDTGLGRAVGTVSRTTTTVTNDTLSVTKTFTATGSKTIQEIGLFNASSSGTMLGHALTGSLAAVNLNLVVATYTVKFS